MRGKPEFKLIVAGGRDFADRDVCWREILAMQERLAGYQLSIVSGMARGADRLGFEVAKKEGIPVHMFPADWDRYGKSAGYRRNEEMARFADGLLAFWNKSSRGTAHMIETMNRAGKPVHIVYY